MPKLPSWLWALVVLIAAGMVLYYKPLSGGYSFTGPDALAPVGTTAGIQALEAETGELPLWMPWLFSGMPTIHSFTYLSIFYLPNKVLGVLAPVLPDFSSYLLHMVFAGFGCFLLIQWLGGSFAAGLLGGTGFLLMPYFNTMLVHGHGSQMMSLAYLPWLIWGLLRLHARRSLPAAALLALLTGMQLQRGHAQIAYYSLLLLGLFFVVLAVRSLRDKDLTGGQRGRFVTLFALAMIVGFGLAAVLYLPVMSYTPFSIRGGQLGGGTGIEYATQWSFSFSETLTFLLPSFFGFGGATYWGDMPFTDYPNYMGLLLLALAVWAVAVRRTWFTWTMAGGAVLAYFLSLGHNFFLYRLFYDLFPYFNKFRVPSMLLVLTQFGVAVLAGLGLDAWLQWLGAQGESRARRILVWTGGAVVVLGLLFLASASVVGSNLPVPRGVPAQMVPQVNGLRMSMIRADAVWLLVLGGLAVGGLYLWRAGSLSKRWLLAGLVAVSMVDLGRIDLRIIEPAEGSLRSPVLRPRSVMTRYLNSDPVLEFLGGDTATFRIRPLGRLQNENRWALAGVSSVSGYHAAKLANYDRFMQATGFQSEGILRMLNVKYLVSLQQFSDPRLREVFVGNLYSGGSYQPAAVYELDTFLERAWFPRRVEPLPSADDILARLRDPAYDPETVVYIQAHGPDDPIAPPFQGEGRVVQANWQPNQIRLQVTAAREALLVLSEVVYPEGWRATVDGEPVPIHEVNTILRGVVVPSGTHDIALDFAPGDYRLGLLLGRLSLLLIGLGFLPGAVREIRKRL